MKKPRYKRPKNPPLYQDIQKHLDEKQIEHKDQQLFEFFSTVQRKDYLSW